MLNTFLNTINLSKKEIVRYGVQILSILGFIAIIYLFYWGFTEEIFTSEEALRDFLEFMGPIAPFIFLAIQVVQVIIPIIPGSLTIPLGAMVFGMGTGFLLNFIGIMTGSMINFWLARKLGRPYVEYFMSEKQVDKYMGWLENEDRFDKLLTIALFVPIAPDDLLCYLAGLSTISFKKFLLILSPAKSVTLLVYSVGLATLLSYLFQLIG